MILFRKPWIAWTAFVAAIALACGGQVDGGGAAASISGAGGASLGAASGEPAAGTVQVAQAAGGSIANAGAPTAMAGAASAGGAKATCELPIAPLPSDSVACDSTVKKGGACTTENFRCFKPCGPATSGWKSETCQGGVFIEVSACVWTAADYSAFRIPAAQDPACPPYPSILTTPCTLAPCTVCYDPGTEAFPADVSIARAGYCICVPTSDGAGKWSCGAVATSWPCPSQPGC